MSDNYDCPVCRLPGSDHEDVHKENERLKGELIAWKHSAISADAQEDEILQLHDQLVASRAQVTALEQGGNQDKEMVRKISEGQDAVTVLTQGMGFVLALQQQLAAINQVLPDFVQADGTPAGRITQLEGMWRTAVEQLAAMTQERDAAVKRGQMVLKHAQEGWARVRELECKP